MATEVLASEQEGFEKLIAQHRGMILGLCVDALRDEQYVPLEAEDLVQEVMVDIWQRLDEVRQARNPKAYLRQCCRNRISDVLKERGAAPTPTAVKTR